MRINNGTLVMVADGTKLLLFRNDGDAKYPVLTTLAHEQIDNPPTHEQGSDAPGRAFSSSDGRRSSYGETDWHRQAQEKFAAHAEAELERVTAKESSGIVVIAAPRTLGEFRKHYGKQIKRQLLAEIPKDLTGHITDDIIEVISAHTL